MNPVVRYIAEKLDLLDPYGPKAVGMRYPRHYAAVADRYLDAWHAMSTKDIEENPERANHLLTQAKVYRELTEIAKHDENIRRITNASV